MVVEPSASNGPSTRDQAPPPVFAPYPIVSTNGLELTDTPRFLKVFGRPEWPKGNKAELIRSASFAFLPFGPGQVFPESLDHQFLLGK